MVATLQVYSFGSRINLFCHARNEIYFFHFIIGYEKNPAELQLLKKDMVVIRLRNKNRQNEIQPNWYQMVTCFNLI